MTPVLLCQKINKDNKEQVKHLFNTAYINSSIKWADDAVSFNKTGMDALRPLAKLREKDWGSTKRLHRDADLTGLAGELAVYRLLGLTADAAWELFSEGLNGDKGYDLVVGKERVDVKSTASDKQLRFKFSKTNRHRDVASVYVFCHVTYTSATIDVKVLGWAFKHKLAPFRRDHDERFFRVEFSQTLIRKGAAHPISTLKALQERGI